jgi:hypothetical protein
LLVTDYGSRALAACLSEPVKPPAFTFDPEGTVDEEVFNLEIRKFLKRFGVTAQREIEKAVETARKRGTLEGNEILPVRATLGIPGVLSDLEIDGEIALASRP